MILLKKEQYCSFLNSVAHIVNPFKASPSSDLFIAQPITFQSMIHAKEIAKDQIRVELFSAQFEEDKNMVPEGFITTENLDRSVLDLHTFEHKVKLPLLEDILERVYKASQADYLIYTNVDIGLYPDFYLAINRFIDEGHDAFIINRRRLPAIYKSTKDLESIYKEKGSRHPGFDCFVFRREIYPLLKLQNICIGVPFVEISFSQNLFALSEHFKLFDKEHLTFHIGLEVFKKRAPQEYVDYNRKNFWKLIKTLDPKPDLKKFPYATYSWPFRFIRRGLHPCIPILLVLKLELAKLKKWSG